MIYRDCVFGASGIVVLIVFILLFCLLLSLLLLLVLFLVLLPSLFFVSLISFSVLKRFNVHVGLHNFW